MVSWSMNTDYIIQTEEHKTASSQRLVAIEKVVNAGYLVGLHFDPMIYYDNWELDYMRLLDSCYQVLPKDQIAWISIGSLRFNPRAEAAH